MSSGDEETIQRLGYRIVAVYFNDSNAKDC